MIAHAEPYGELSSPRSTPSIVADALTRIPTIHFRDVAWAKDSIASCAATLARAFDGDRACVWHWLRETAAPNTAEPLFAVLCAVCDALIAGSFATHDDSATLTSFCVAVERDVFDRLRSERFIEDAHNVNDLATNEFADGLLRIVHLHDRDTASHLEATAALARRIGTAMRLTDDQLGRIELAGRLHDIGKIATGHDLLGKAGRPTAAEWDQIRREPQDGAAALAEIPKLSFLAPIVRSHRERFDGSGYPDGLRADDIPFEARVVAVADAFHAMTTKHPYHRAMLPNDALAELAANAGTQFDPEVVEATFGLFRYSRRSRRAIA